MGAVASTPKNRAATIEVNVILATVQMGMNQIITTRATTTTITATMANQAQIVLKKLTITLLHHFTLKIRIRNTKNIPIAIRSTTLVLLLIILKRFALPKYERIAPTL